MQIDLRTVPFYWLNGREHRREHMNTVLQGFRHERVDGTPPKLLDNPDLRVLAPLGHAKVIEHAVNRMTPGRFEPFVLMEDDVAWRTSPAPAGPDPLTISFPDDADAVYLGISRAACRPDANDYHYEIMRRRCVEYPHLQRVYNMLTAHAVLFLTFRHALAYTRAMIESCSTREPCDTISCKLAVHHEVFALGEPLFYQTSVVGGQEWETRIAWTDDGTVSDQFDARRYYSVHPWSLLVFG